MKKQVPLISKRRGKVGAFQQAIYDALLPVAEDWKNKGWHSQDAFLGLLQSSVDDVIMRIRK